MEKIEKMLKVLADKNRLRILMLLAERKMCVCELSHIIGIAGPSISRHIKKMLDAELICGEKDGLWTNYFICHNDLFGPLFEPVAQSLKYDEQVLDDKKKIPSLDRECLCKK